MKKLPAQLIKICALVFVFTALMMGDRLLAQAQAPGALGTQEQSQVSLTAIPPRLGDEGDLAAKPGEVIQTQVRVNNPTNEAVTISSSAYDFTIDVDGETPIPIEGDVSSRWSLANWLVLAPATQTIAPNQTAVVNVLVEVPDDALPGGHFAMITHQPTQSGVQAIGQQAATSGINQRVGTLLYVFVEGPINEEAFIRNAQFPKLTEFGPVPFSFSIENMSDIHIRPQISVEIRDWLGRTSDAVLVNPKNIFPLTSRDFDGQWDRIWGIGRYSATITASYGQSGSLAVAKTHFWLIPITLVIAILVVILTLIAVGIAVRRHIIHRKTDQSGKIQELESKIRELESQQSSDSGL